MSRENSQPITVRFDGINYNHWSFLMRSFLKGKSMWKYVDGIEKKPTTSSSVGKGKENETQKKDPKEEWDINNHRILTWIGNTIIPSISMQLTSFEVAKDAWDFLSKRYTQINFAQRYKLEQDIRSMKQSHDQSIFFFHSEMSLIWNQLALMEPIWTVDLELWQKYREETRLVQFLMALRDEFESVRASILHRSPLPTVEVALSELITEETRKRITPDISGVFVVPSRSSPNNFPRNSNAQVQRDMSQVQCHNCKTFGHLARNCNLPSANTSPAATIPDTPTTQCGYCKEFGHSSRFCTSPTSRNMRRINANGGNKFNTPTRFTAAPVSSATDPYATSTTSSALVVPGGGSTPNLADIQEMIKQALSIGNKPTAASAFSISSGSQNREASWDRL
ncbi:uncharacterized protein LOC113321639 [Papaver somniferum]|uniref:uncharacterized protein LOC113321639 n=1 Tax=Papaver somniferum TaxID=3469 RepID=UPI000E7045E0|nr:uncharacterized protein LOC113321639 [Papaver somniferum]